MPSPRFPPVPPPVHSIHHHRVHAMSHGMTGMDWVPDIRRDFLFPLPHFSNEIGGLDAPRLIPAGGLVKGYNGLLAVQRYSIRD